MSSLGDVIAERRKQKHWTQKQLAQRLYVSDKAVSKWERNLGMPELSLLAPLSRELGITMEELLNGELPEREITMKRTCFYLCPVCGNLITGSRPAFLSCCGQKLQPFMSEKPTPEHSLHKEIVEGEWYLTTDHPMTKDHYITFVALVTGDKVHLCRQYPEQMLSLRLPKQGHGTLYYHCSQHGLFSERL